MDFTRLSLWILSKEIMACCETNLYYQHFKLLCLVHGNQIIIFQYVREIIIDLELAGDAFWEHFPWRDTAVNIRTLSRIHSPHPVWILVPGLSIMWHSGHLTFLQHAECHTGLKSNFMTLRAAYIWFHKA